MTSRSGGIPDETAEGRREGLVWAHSWRLQSIKARKTWRQQCEEDGHMDSAVGRQRAMNAGSHFTFSFTFHKTPRPPAHGTVLPTFRVDLLISINPI